MKTTSIFLIGTVVGIILTFLFLKFYFEGKLGMQVSEFETRIAEMQQKISDQEKIIADQEKLIAELRAKLKILSPWSEEILAAPEFTDDIPAEMETNRLGEVRVSWKPVDGSKKTLIVLTDQNGKEIKTFSSPRDAIYLKEIPTKNEIENTYYFLHLLSVNGNDEKGPPGEKRGLIVKPYARISAPKIEEILIED